MEGSASAGDGGAAAFRAGARYQTGCDGTPKDLTRALCCYVEAAAAGHGHARHALCLEFSADEHLESAARLPQVHEIAMCELTANKSGSLRTACAYEQQWQSWLADVERRWFFADDVALGDRNQQLARLSGCITPDTPPPSVALVWLLVDLIDAHDCPALVYSGGATLLQYTASTAVSTDLQTAACTLLAVLSERASAQKQHNVTPLWRNTAATLVENLVDEKSESFDTKVITIPALECLSMPCVLPHADPQTLAKLLKRTMQCPGRIFEKACCCVCAAVATDNLEFTRALITMDVAQELFTAVEKHCRNANGARQEVDCSSQEILLLVFQTLRALLSTGELDGPLACVAEPLIGNAIPLSLRASGHPIRHEAFLLLLETIARPWPVLETTGIDFVASAMMAVIESADVSPTGTLQQITALKAFVAWLPQSDWDMVPSLVAVACSIERDHASVSACAEWCATVAPRVNEWTPVQLSAVCDYVAPRSPVWFARQDHPEAALAVTIMWSELLKKACGCTEPSGTQTVRCLLSMLDKCEGLQFALKLAVDFEQAAHLIAQTARARHYPALECREHSSDAAGQYLSLLVQAHVTPRLCYTIAGVRGAFQNNDGPQQALLVDTWAGLDPIPEPSLVLVNAALEQTAAKIHSEGFTALPLGIFFRLVWLCQQTATRSEVGVQFAQACNRGLQDYEGLTRALCDVPAKLIDAVMLWLFKNMDKDVLSATFLEWLRIHNSPSDNITTECTPVQSVDTWMLSSTYSVQFALHLLSDTAIDSDLESNLLDFLLVSLQHGGIDSLDEICTHGTRVLTCTIRSCIQAPKASVAVRCLHLLKRSLDHCLCSAGRHQREQHSEHVIPLLGSIASLLSSSVSTTYDGIDVGRMTGDAKCIISGCVECLFLTVESSHDAAAAVIAAMRPGADGAVSSQMYHNLYKLLLCASQMEEHDDDLLAAVASIISLFVSLLYKDDGLELVNNLMHFVPPAVGALACTWLAASWQLKREQECNSSTPNPRTARTTCLPSIHPELHMQLLNLVLVGNMSTTPLVPISAAYCLEELYWHCKSDTSEKQDASTLLLYGWPSHVARVARNALMCRISASLEEDQTPSVGNRAAATETAELVAASKSRASESTELFPSLSNADAEAATARMLGAIIARWPEATSALFESTDTAAVLRYVAKRDESNQIGFHSLVSAFAKDGVAGPGEQQEALACIHQIEQCRQAPHDQMATIVWIRAVQNGLTIPLGYSCRALCERTLPTLWS